MSVDQDRKRDEDALITRSAKNARQGRVGWQVNAVLVVSLTLVIIGMAIVYFFFFA